MNRFGKYLFMALVYGFLYGPIVVLMIFSFNASKYGVAWTGFSLKWYGELLRNTQLLESAFNSLLIAVLSATIATILGTLTAFALARYDFSGKKVYHSALYVVIMSPDIVMGTAMLVLFVAMKMPLGFQTLLIAHITICLPFVAVTIASRLKDFDRNIVEAAQDLGAGEFEIFRFIVLPMIFPAVLAGWLLALTLSLDDVIISFFVTGPSYEILPLKIYSMVKLGVKPSVNALSTIWVGITIWMVLTAQWLLKERTK